MPDSNSDSSHVINIPDRNLEEDGKFYKFVFILSWVVIMLLDPFWLYLNSIDDRRMCLRQVDTNSKITFVVLRSVIDLFHVLDAFLKPRYNLWLKSMMDQGIPLKKAESLRISRWWQFNTISSAIPYPQLVGAMWYSLAIGKEMACWRKAYPEASGSSRKFSCADPINKVKNITLLLSTRCPIKPPNSTVLNFGIYHDVFESGMGRMANSYRIFPKKLLRCFWWGLRNLSSFGSNLLSGSDNSESIFGIFICTSGLILFLVYLSSNLRKYAQFAKEMSKKLKLKKKMQMINLEIDLWLSKNADVPKNMSFVISKYIEQQVEENKDVDMDNILSILPSRYKRFIMRPLCLDLLKRVTLLEHVDKEVLKAISEHLNSVMYTADCYIIREGEPLGKMFFIRQGTAWSYTTRSNSFVGDGIINCLEKDCFYGEELFDWAFRFESFSNLPVSTRTVMSQEKVEVFVISAKDLKKIVSILWWHFSSNLQIQDIEESLLRQLKNLAMSSLWRRRKAMLANPRTRSHWDNVYDKLIESD